MYLVASARRSVPWTVATELSHYRSLLPEAIHTFEPIAKGKMSTIVGKAREGYTSEWQRRPHVSKVVKTYLETLKWDVLPHLAYPSDIALSNFYIFRSMTNDLVEQHFWSYKYYTTIQILSPTFWQLLLSEMPHQSIWKMPSGSSNLKLIMIAMVITSINNLVAEVSYSIWKFLLKRPLFLRHHHANISTFHHSCAVWFNIVKIKAVAEPVLGWF